MRPADTWEARVEGAVPVLPYVLLAFSTFAGTVIDDRNAWLPTLVLSLAALVWLVARRWLPAAVFVAGFLVLNAALVTRSPIYVAIDWLLFGDRRRLALKRLWVILVYPIVWLIVVLVRGATDGWVPYPFLAPANGYGSVAVYCVIIALVIGAVGLLVLWYSRVRVLKP